MRDRGRLPAPPFSLMMAVNPGSGAGILQRLQPEVVKYWLMIRGGGIGHPGGESLAFRKMRTISPDSACGRPVRKQGLAQNLVNDLFTHLCVPLVRLGTILRPPEDELSKIRSIGRKLSVNGRNCGQNAASVVSKMETKFPGFVAPAGRDGRRWLALPLISFCFPHPSAILRSTLYGSSVHGGGPTGCC